MSQNHRSAIAYHPEYLKYDFGPHHPLRPERNLAGLDLLEKLGAWNRGTELLEPKPATDKDLGLIHDPRYIEVVKLSDWGASFPEFGIGHGDNPAFPQMHESAASVTGGTIEAVRRVMRGELDHAFNAAGGLHHALPARASGFCVYDDPAVGASIAVEEFGARVLYLDFDCHHGDGVQWIFYESPDVLTVSFHESGQFLFPGTGGVDETGKGAGQGFSLNMPFAPFTTDEGWAEALEAIVPVVVEHFRPDLIISSHGADTHAWDPLTHLALTTSSFVHQARLVHSLAHEYSQGRWLAVGSGGYDWRRVVPRAWAIVWAEMTQRTLTQELPVEWRDHWQGEEDMPQNILDEESLAIPRVREQEVRAINSHTIEVVRRKVEAIPATA